MISLGSRRAASLLGACCAAFVATAAAQTDGDELPGATYASLARLPDWSGLWGSSTPRPLVAELLDQPPPFKPEALEAFRRARDDDSPDPLRYCRPWQFTGSSGTFTEALEFLFTPGRVTLTNERGLIRRIYTDGRAMPADLDPTNTGTSIGHWEGQTLVVETTGIDPRALYPGSLQGAIEIGENVTITERIFLKDADTLQFDISTVAPDLFTAPDHRTRLYTRLAKATADEISFCSEYDRSIEPGSGRHRFDMTPPPDLPPPPPR